MMTNRRSPPAWPGITTWPGIGATAPLPASSRLISCAMSLAETCFRGITVTSLLLDLSTCSRTRRILRILAAVSVMIKVLVGAYGEIRACGDIIGRRNCTIWAADTFCSDTTWVIH